jgi:2-polyprenyl-3-methyl-5-hydroxy-6-metoxy-1,4-benzoquinol methylase
MPLNNKKKNTASGALYNEFLDQVPADAEWLIFCDSNLEFLDNPAFALTYLDKHALYGIWGARLVSNADGDLFQECVGQIFFQEAQGQRTLFSGIKSDGAQLGADTLDFCLIVHADTIREYSLRFDPALTALHIEDFCLRAEEHGLPVFVLNLHACTHKHPHKTDSAALAADAERCADKYLNSPARAGTHILFGNTGGRSAQGRVVFTEQCGVDGSVIYHRPVKGQDQNMPVVLAAKMMKPGSRVLDIGCAGGDTGIFLKEALGAKLWGMEYNAGSLGRAESTGVYEKLYAQDLTALDIDKYADFYGFFDYILILDVLEHLTDPGLVLKKLSALLKKGAAFLLSIPNLGHAYPVLNLLNNDFTYADYGILDATHIKFFTWKSLANSLAAWGFKVEDSKASFVIPDDFKAMRAPKHLPQQFYDYLAGNMHFFACQYIIKAVPSDWDSPALSRHNMSGLRQSVNRNPLGLKAKKPALRAFLQQVALARKN